MRVFKLRKQCPSKLRRSEVGLFVFMYYVYILRSTMSPQQVYIGSTSNIKARLDSHNSGANKHTTKFKPWKVVWYSAFQNKQKAIEFEQYLKSASGIAFRRKRLL